MITISVPIVLIEPGEYIKIHKFMDPSQLLRYVILKLPKIYS